MQKRLKQAAYPLSGALYAALILAIVHQLIYHLGKIISLLNGLIHLRPAFLGQITQATEQLKNVPILPPLLPGLLLGTGAGWLLKDRLTTKCRKILLIVLAVLLFVPLTIAALWYTQVNGIRLSALLRRLLPALL